MFWGAVIRENQPYVFSKENSGRVFHLSSASLEETLEKKPVYVKIESKDHKYIICVLRGHKNQSMKLDNFLTIIPGIKFSISNCPNAAVHLTGYYESDETLETGVNNTESTNGDKYFSDHKKGSTPKAQSIVSCETKKEKNIKETKKNIPEDKKTSKDTTIEKKVKNVVTEEKKIPAQSNKSLEVKTPPEIITVPSVKKNPLPVPEKKQREIKNEKKDVNAKLLEEDDESDEEYEQEEEDEDEEEENEEEEDDYENLDDMKELNDDDQKEDSQDEKELNLLLNNKSDLKYTIAKGESKVKSENLSDSKPQNQPIDKELEEDDVNSVFKKGEEIDEDDEIELKQFLQKKKKQLQEMVPNRENKAKHQFKSETTHQGKPNQNLKEKIQVQIKDEKKVFDNKQSGLKAKKNFNQA